MNYRLQYWAVRLLAALATLFPVEVTDWVTRRFGDLSYLILSKRRKIAFENITYAFGSALPDNRKKQITRSAFQSAALSMTELFTVRKIKKTARDRFKLFGNESLEKAFAEKKGVVLVISHLGSWEYLSFLPFLTGQPWSVVVKDIKNPYLNEAINDMRRVMTVNPISKDSSIRTVLSELKKGRGVAILIDQWAGREGLWTEFFGEKTSTTSIPARLAEKTGCALVPAYCLRKEPGRYEIHAEKAVAWDRNRPDWETVLTEQLNGILERQIRQYPEQWLWGHRRWKEMPATVRNAE
ncbi:MAG TPA: lysophospholipid acyltransferase family protein [Candidatus Omnitrophota bacterium]|nr:lysophospholipid acyltransferase family protein [Candidatus Omnitrophota bacterium]